jgi:glycosyltransferase involved in cell wall biosynthesis
MPPQPPPNSRAIVLTEIEAMGGAERSVLALSRWLSRHNLPNHIVTYVDHIGLARYVDHPLDVIELRPSMRARKKISSLRRYFHQANITAPKPLMSGYQPALHATIAGLRGFHCLMHDTPSLFEPAATLNLKRRLARRLSDTITGYGLRSGGHTIVTSEYLRRECRRTFNLRSDIARMGGLATHTFHPRAVTTELRLLSVSRIEPNKRIDWILRPLAALEAASPALSSRISWCLDIAGRGSALDSMQQLAQSLHLTDRVHLHGYIPDAELEALYNSAHLFLMPAVQGYGIPAIEALSRGIPVLLHRDSGVSDILRKTPWAVVIAGDESSMLPGLQRAIETVRTGAQLNSPLPPLPTEDHWAERVATLCGWL